MASSDARDALLSSLLLARAAARPLAPAVPSWRREEQWRADAPVALAHAQLGHAFEYAFDDVRCLPLCIEESHDFVGSRVWDAAVLLSKCLEHAHARGALRLAGARVLELGAGTGLCGLVAARLGDGATRVVCTDQPPLVGALQRNVAANGEAARVEGAACTWGDGGHHARLDARLRELAAAAADAQRAGGGGDGAPPRLLDLIIASDMAAPVKYVPGFMATLQHLMPPDAAPHAAPELLLGVQLQRDFTQPLLDACRACYDVRELPPCELHPRFASPRHAVLRVRVRGAVGPPGD